jgi:DNA-binding GntR family transcriptional regulator
VAASETASSRVEDVTRQLRERIFQGKLAPGTALRELVLARELGVSQTTVREALRQLEHSGLVSKQVNRGSTVTRLSAKEIRERVTLRALLEGMTAQAAATRMQEEHFAELEKRLTILDDAVRSNSYYEAAQADLNFHRYVWICSGNETLCNVLELITIPLFAFISILRSQGVQRLLTVVDAHAPLIAALRSRDPNVIREAFETGATSSYRNFMQQSEDHALASAFGYLEHPNHSSSVGPG